MAAAAVCVAFQCLTAPRFRSGLAWFLVSCLDILWKLSSSFSHSSLFSLSTTHISPTPLSTFDQTTQTPKIRHNGSSDPPGGTYLDTFKKSFVDVKPDADKENAIPTTEFLDAAESLTTIFDALGGVAFGPVKSDMGGNIKELVKNELATKKHVATEGLLWLTRGLEFTCIALSQNVAKESEELSESFRNAYSTTLKPHHSFLVKPIFSAAMSACPYRKDFYAKLGSDQAKVAAELRVYLASLEKIVGILKGFLASKDAKF
ncbi:HET-C2 protein [Colletotrichum tofieldiae]|nr:HET-C2 protein [Colletotrichum tofieldiae]